MNNLVKYRIRYMTSTKPKAPTLTEELCVEAPIAQVRSYAKSALGAVKILSVEIVQ